jgi:hypothetical protein
MVIKSFKKSMIDGKVILRAPRIFWAGKLRTPHLFSFLLWVVGMKRETSRNK